MAWGVLFAVALTLAQPAALARDADAAPAQAGDVVPALAPVTGAAPAIVVEAPEVGATVVTLAGASLPVYVEPDGALKETLDATAAYGTPTTLLAVGDLGAVPGWIQVQLPERPGHDYGWVRSADVYTTQTFDRIDVYLAQRELDFSRDGAVQLTTSVAVGGALTPTPLGLYYVTERIDLSAQPSGVYGAFILALSGYSEALTRFHGGAPQLAIHGTNAPASIGNAVSNGCVRVPADALATLSGEVAVGTPVTIHASR